MYYKIDIDKLECWMKQHFMEYKETTDGYTVNSPYKSDTKFKLSISVSKNCFHCWKTDNSGVLWKLVSDVNHCSKQEAVEQIYEISILSNFKEQLEKITNKHAKTDSKTDLDKRLTLPSEFKQLTLDDESDMCIDAMEYCVGRNINPINWRLGYCASGYHAKRIIIPFYKNKELIYWIGRGIYDYQQPKYLNPIISDIDLDVKKSDILFSRDWNFKGDVFVVEGAFDAMSLIECGINAVAILGKCLSDKHISYLKDSNIVLAFDKDVAGMNAMAWNAKKLSNFGINSVKYVFPYNGKDWNEIHSKNELNKEDVLQNVKNLGFMDKLMFEKAKS